MSEMLFSFEGAILQERSGDDSEVDTPEPIPNSEVKHFSGDNSWACPCEDSTLPGPFFMPFFLLPFLIWFIVLKYTS